MLRSILKLSIALSTLFAMLAPAQASFYSVETQPDYIADANLVQSIELAYASGELNAEEAQYLIMMAREQGATAAEIWQWMKGAYGSVKGTVKLGYRCVKAWGARKWCMFWSKTDQARQACDDKYFPSILNNCLAQQD